ncbi:unnamed protein product [Candida verbasci]|uniref:Cyclin-like domain-containing protein n=1 Tax=Candida verbasci TaxID=1227364 RepID=A0A9W4TV03_9ASCO|nr:unnamed protein product [Candida verbasci]
MAGTNNDKIEPTLKKKMISNDDLYRHSSQYNFWSFTEEQLVNLRKQTNLKGQKIAKDKFQQEYTNSKLSNPEIFDKFQQELKEENLLNLISYEEELTFLDFYIQNITTSCNFFKMPTQVRLTASSFFKKFYLNNSVMEYHPKNILYTCIFLAAKSENYFISIESFVKPLSKIDSEHILDLEYIVLQSLKFTLMVHHPIRPLYGIFLDSQAELLHPQINQDINIDKLGDLYNHAREWLNKYYMISDVAFLFTPPQIALASMYDIDQKITENYLKRKFLKNEKLTTIKEEPESTEDVGRTQLTTLIETIQKCISVAKQSHVADREASKEIDRKCFYALNPKNLIDKRIKKLTNNKEST